MKQPQTPDPDSVEPDHRVEELPPYGVVPEDMSELDASERDVSMDSQFLLVRARAGDSGALNELFARYRERVLKIARVRVGPLLASRIEPDDIVQEAMLRAWPRIHEFEPNHVPRLIHWMARFVEHAILDAVKRETTASRDPKRELPMESLRPRGSDTTAIPLPGSDATPSQIHSAEEQENIYEKSLYELPEHYREVILMRRVSKFSWREIAAHFGQPSAEAAAELHRRANEALKPKLKSNGFQFPGGDAS